MLTFTTKNGEVDIRYETIATIRETLDSEKPGAVVIATIDGKHHIVMEDMAKVRNMIEHYFD